MTAGAPVEVHLLALPVPLAGRARQHFEGLRREFVLLAAQSDDEQHVPARLMQLVETLTAQYAGANTDADDRLEDAIDAGTPVLADHVLQLPPAAGPAVEALAALLDEADEFCRQGQHLLMLATPPDCVAYRRWYLGEVVGQLAGRPAVAWPDSGPARALARS